LVSAVLAGRYLFSPGFWQAVAKKHESETFLRGFQEIGRPVERREQREVNIPVIEG
jgi:hypothetical protein